MNIFLSIGFFFIGISIGSFIAARIFDLVSHQHSALMQRSACHHCGQTITLPYILPLIGYFLAKGKCTHCKTPLWKWYWKIELTYGVFYSLVFLLLPLDSFGSIVHISITLLLGSLLLYISISDMFLQAFPVEALSLGVILLLFLRGLQEMTFPWDNLEGALVGLGIFLGLYGITRLLYKKESMGTGDIFLATFIGAGLGVLKGLLAFYFAFILGGLLAALLMLWRKQKGSDTLAFGPLLALGAVCSYLLGDFLLAWYSSFF